MAEMKLSVFGKTKALVGQIDEFLDKVSEGAMVFEQGLASYMDSGAGECCEEKLEQIRALKDRASELCRTVDRSLYTEMLLPDSRGDVLSLLDDLYELLDDLKDCFVDVTVERPDVPDELKAEFKSLVSSVVNSVEYTVQAARAFFRDFQAVRDHIHKIGFYEEEADNVSLRLKTDIFQSDLPLARKLHLTQWVDAIEQVSDAADDVGDRLAIYAIKRSL